MNVKIGLTPLPPSVCFSLLFKDFLLQDKRTFWMTLFHHHHSRFWTVFIAKVQITVFLSLHFLYYSLYDSIIKIYLTHLIYHFWFIQIIQCSEDDGKIGMFMTIDKQIQKLKKGNAIQDYQNAANLRYMKIFFSCLSNLI